MRDDASAEDIEFEQLDIRTVSNPGGRSFRDQRSGHQPTDAAFRLRSSVHRYGERVVGRRPTPLDDNDLELLRATQRISEYGFLLGHGVSADDILACVERAELLGVTPQSVMIARSLVTADVYLHAMSVACGAPVINARLAQYMHLRRAWMRRHQLQAKLNDQSLPPPDAIFSYDGNAWLVLDGLAKRPNDISTILRQLNRAGTFPALTTVAVLQSVAKRDLDDVLSNRAVNLLRETQPKAAAVTGVPTIQLCAVLGSIGLFLGAAAIVPNDALLAMLFLLTLPFLVATAVRLAALCHALRPTTTPLPPDIADGDLPVYTVLVPLFQEAGMLPSLVQALRKLDYPSEKLDIKLILEAIDLETIAVARNLNLTSPFEILVVPDGQPRTKPRALNYALVFAKGSLVVVYDAEDIPDPDQLRRAASTFRNSPDSLGCLQGRLTIDNGDASWLSHQFDLEYLTLFDAFLPALEAMRLPLPLGGTSNHFPTRVLRDVGGWDAHNVTEDADLGVRLTRKGYRVRVLPTRTYEEAPVRFAIWMRQRTRWMKGYLQTWFVHMRQPSRLLRELGLRGFLGFQVAVGGTVLSALVVPLFLAGAGFALWHGTSLQPPESTIGRLFYWLSFLNLAVGWTAPWLLALAAIVRARRYDLLPAWPLHPAYWLLMAIPAWRAILHLWRSPYTWEKTAHGGSRRRTARSRRLSRHRRR